MQKTPGQESFEAYNAAGANPGKTHDDKDVPAWDNLSIDVRAKWAAAEKAAGRARLDSFPSLASVAAFAVEEAFAAALKRYDDECIMHNACLTTRVLLECFADELSKRQRGTPW